MVALVHAGVVVSILAGHAAIWPMHNDTVHRLGPGADFFAVYHAGVNLQRNVSPYADLPDGVTPYFYYFRYLPAVAVGGRVLTVLPPRAAYVLWCLLVEGLLVLLAVVFWRRIEDRRLGAFAVCALLLSSPYFLELYMGQFTFAAVGLLVLGLTTANLRGALGYAAAAVLKIFPLATAPALLRSRRYWLHLVLGIGAVIGLSAPHFLRHPVDWRVFYELNVYSEGGLHSGNHGLVYLVHLVTVDLGILLDPLQWVLLTQVFRWAVMLVTALLVLLSRDDRVVPGAVVMLLAHFISYPHVWEHHASGIVLLGLTLLLASGPMGRAGLVVVLGSLLLLCAPTPFALFDRAKDPSVWDPAVDWPRYASYLVLLPKVVPTVALYLFGVFRLARSGFRSPLAGLRPR